MLPGDQERASRLAIHGEPFHMEGALSHTGARLAAMSLSSVFRRGARWAYLALRD